MTSFEKIAYLATSVLLVAFRLTNADYKCACNYNVEKEVQDSFNTVIGYLYEFDCKPIATFAKPPENFLAIQFEKQVGYIEVDEKVEEQTCPGDMPEVDAIPTTTSTPIVQTEATSSLRTSPTTMKQDSTTTSSQTTVSTTKPLPTTMTKTTATTTPMPTTSSTTTSPTTTTSRPTTTPTTTQTTTTTTTPKPTTTSTTTSTSTTMSTSTTTTALPTTQFTYWQEAANVTGTPYQYVGVGYRLLDGNPEVETDPGLMLDKRVLQLTGQSSSVREASYTLGSVCTPEKQHALVHGSLSLQKEMMMSVKSSGLQIDALNSEAFVFNPDFKTVRDELDHGDQVLQSQISTCKLGTVRYENERATAEKFTVSRDFATTVCTLPLELNGTSIKDYLHFIDEWGTNVVKSADLGMKDVTHFPLSRTQLFNHVIHKDTSVLDHDGTFEGFSSSILINIERYLASPLVNDVFGVAQKTRVGSLTDPKVVAVTLVPVSDFINTAYFDPILGELVKEGACSNVMYTTGIQRLHQNMVDALRQYAGFRKAGNPISGQVQDYPLQIPVTWPKGTYGLMKPPTGCPLDKVHWYEGWRQQDSEDSNTNNYFSNNIRSYLAGTFDSNIRTAYCMKTTPSVSKYDMDWPSGRYCILKKGSCPVGFTSGYIFWDDEDRNNGNKHGGILPDGDYGSNTKVFYCCRADAHSNTKIILPRDRPFVMLRYGPACQSVYGMGVTDVFVRWDDDDLFNSSSGGGMHPYDEGGSDDHLLHFCYYDVLRGGDPIIG